MRCTLNKPDYTSTKHIPSCFIFFFFYKHNSHSFLQVPIHWWCSLRVSTWRRKRRDQMFLSSFLTTALRTEHQKQGARSKKAALLVRAAIPTGQGNVADASVVPHMQISMCSLKFRKRVSNPPILLSSPSEQRSTRETRGWRDGSAVKNSCCPLT